MPKKFTIPVWWSVESSIEVEAETLEEAIVKVENQGIDLPEDEEVGYIDGSFTVNHECARALANEMDQV